jgi:hypothetical protein
MATKRGRPISTSNADDERVSRVREQNRARRREYDARKRAQRALQTRVTRPQLQQGERIIQLGFQDEEIEPTPNALGLRLQNVTIGQDFAGALAQRNAIEVDEHDTLYDDPPPPRSVPGDSLPTQPIARTDGLRTGSHESVAPRDPPRSQAERHTTTLGLDAVRPSLSPTPSTSTRGRRTRTLRGTLRHPAGHTRLPLSTSPLSETTITRFFTRRIGQDPFQQNRSLSLPAAPVLPLAFVPPRPDEVPGSSLAAPRIRNTSSPPPHIFTHSLLLVHLDPEFNNLPPLDLVRCDQTLRKTTQSALAESGKTLALYCIQMSGMALVTTGKILALSCMVTMITPIRL